MNEEHDKDIEYISKSQMKREMLALQELGEKLVALSPDKLGQLELPEDLLTAVVQAQSIKKHGARRRQMQFIGRLMRNVDASSIQHQLDNVTLHSAQAINQLHKIEKWRERLLEQGNEALTEFLTEFPDADHQQLKTLVRNAIKEKNDGKPPKFYRKIFQFIKQYIES